MGLQQLFHGKDQQFEKEIHMYTENSIGESYLYKKKDLGQAISQASIKFHKRIILRTMIRQTS